jgi:hypothetical protein
MFVILYFEERGLVMSQQLEKSLNSVLSYLAAETLKARKCGRIKRAEKLSIAFKILSSEYDEITSRGKADERSCW